MAELTWQIISLGVIIAIGLLAILALWRLLKERRAGFPAKDERIQYLNGRAALYALFIGSYFILAFLAIYIFSKEVYDMPDIDAGYPMIWALLVFNVSFIILRFYLDRKGD